MQRPSELSDAPVPGEVVPRQKGDESTAATHAVVHALLVRGLRPVEPYLPERLALGNQLPLDQLLQGSRHEHRGLLMMRNHARPSALGVRHFVTLRAERPRQRDIRHAMMRHTGHGGGGSGRFPEVQWHSAYQRFKITPIDFKSLEYQPGWGWRSEEHPKR